MSHMTLAFTCTLAECLDAVYACERYTAATPGAVYVESRDTAADTRITYHPGESLADLLGDLDPFYHRIATTHDVARLLDGSCD